MHPHKSDIPPKDEENNWTTSNKLSEKELNLKTPKTEYYLRASML